MICNKITNDKKTSVDKNKGEYENKYESMSPKDDIEINQYSELIHALSNDKLLNIGVTGPYSSGKSSVIKSIFKKKELLKNTLFVSFADFKGKKVKSNIVGTNYDENSVDISELEKTIIDEICNYSVIKKFKSKKYWKRFLILLLIFILGSLVFIKSICEFICNNTLISVPIFLLCIITLLIISYYINNFSFKITYSNFEVDVKNKDEIFDHNINYLIEILKTLKIKYIVFEDIDRYQDVEIFEKIHNMNTLINLSLESKVKFIYVVSDNLIGDGLNRVKFFDYIYPIIPFVSYSTSGDKALTRLKTLGLIGKNGLDRKFIYNTFLYINDYRIVTDIINEYIVYLNAIDESIKNCNYFNYNSLFAIISYKVLFPEDFSKLEKESDDCILLSAFDCKSFKEIKEKATEIMNEEDKEEKLKTLSEALKLLAYFITSGYILRETYKMYIKRYYFDEMDINDFNFIQQANMKNIEEKDIDFKLAITHPDIVIERLDETSYNNISSLNYNLLSELLSKNTSNYKELLKKYIDTIFNLKNKYKFLYGFYEFSGKKFDKLLKQIIDEEKDIINDLIDLDECSYKNDFIYLILNKYGLPELKIADINYEKLIKIIRNSKIGIKNEVSGVFTTNIAELSTKGLKYDDLRGIKSDELLETIVENDSYEINKDNINLILKRYYEYSNKNIKKQPIKLILDKNNSYILSDKNRIVGIYCENVSDLYVDDQDIIKTILSDSSISTISKENFIHSEKTKIEDISYIIDVDVLNKIIEEDRLVCSWDNIYYYYAKASSKDILSNYLSSNAGNNLSNEDINDNIKQDFSFLKYVISIGNISNELFDKILNTYPDKYNLLEMFSTKTIAMDEYKLDKLLNIHDFNHKEEIQRFKIKIINNNFDLINETNVSDKLNKIGHDYSWMLINNKKPEISNNIETKNLIENLNSKLKYNIDYEESNERIFIKGRRNKKQVYSLNR
ncbi:MAG: hypothetical protein IJO32_01205 [Bacilli bacterium]|nr:hypothetical protein [Bacilli bacterium]